VTVRLPRLRGTLRAMLLAPHAATRQKTETKTRGETALMPPWNVIVHDDPVTLMQYVTKVFMQVFGYAQDKAQRLMLEVHQSGRSVVWTGAREQAEVYAEKLQAHHLLTSLEPVAN
jgi:ATP-dependent Clp protease adaptor protein ClpS